MEFSSTDAQRPGPRGHATTAPSPFRVPPTGIANSPTAGSRPDFRYRRGGLSCRGVDPEARLAYPARR